MGCKLSSNWRKILVYPLIVLDFFHITRSFMKQLGADTKSAQVC